jgi:hypothetical protein
MMKKKRKKKPVTAEPRFVKLSSERRIILLDQQPLREEAGRAARKKIGEMEKLNTSLSEFEKTIRPAYERWEAETLGPLLAEERQLIAKISHLEHLISRAGLEALFTGRDPQEIYEEVAREQQEWEERQASGEPESPGPEPEEPYDPDAEREFPDEEREFRAYVRYACGDEPDQFSKREYKKLFNEYREWKKKREGEGGSVGRKKEDVPARVKELYRVLVRRLHPDTGKSRNDPNVQRLWHDLQTAYAAQDVERLEVLLAMTDLHESGSAIRSTLFHLRKVAKEMENTVRELKARFREARTSPAWAFWHSDNREKAGAKIRAATEARIREAKNHITILEAEINLWKKDARQPTRREPGSKNHKAKKKSPPIFGESQPNSNSTPPRKQSGASKDQGFFDF